jgi:hypothetical protein
MALDAAMVAQALDLRRVDELVSSIEQELT